MHPCLPTPTAPAAGRLRRSICSRGTRSPMRTGRQPSRGSLLRWLTRRCRRSRPIRSARPPAPPGFPRRRAATSPRMSCNASSPACRKGRRCRSSTRDAVRAAWPARCGPSHSSTASRAAPDVGARAPSGELPSRLFQSSRSLNPSRRKDAADRSNPEWPRTAHWGTTSSASRKVTAQL
jgi:hypothetical protein